MSEFLILGGTGKVGSRVAQFLASTGHRARVAGRSGPTRFDWHVDETWGPALAGVDGVFIVGPGSASDWSPALTRLLAEADRAGARRAVLLSARGVEFLPGGAVDRAERALMAGPVPWTILRPTHFAQNFTEAMFAPRGGVIAAPVGDAAEPFIDVADLAEVAATALVSDGDARGGSRIIELSGPSALTFAQAAAIIGEAAGTQVEFRPQADAAHEAELRASGTPEGYVRWRMAMLGGIARGEDAYLSDGVQAVLGRPATHFRQWALREVPDSAWARP